MILATHEAGPNAWFPVALLVPALVSITVAIGLSQLRPRRLPRLMPVLAIGVSVLTLHVSMVTWRHSKDVAMCRSWDGGEDQERCISERRERGRGPWGLLVAPPGGRD